MTGTAADVRRWRANLQGEVDGAAVYRAMARSEGEASLAVLYEKLAATEDRHAAVWRAHLADAGESARLAPSWRARVLALAARWGGAGFVLPTLAAREARDQQSYDAQPEAGVELPRDERSHARVLRELAGPGGMSGPAIARLEGRHRAAGGNALRAAVLGVDDGLLSNFGLVMGVAGAGGDTRGLVVAGLAGMLAGALSMALGEWLSVQSARELYARQLSIERAELESAPEEEEEELALIYQTKGLGAEKARLMAAQVIRSDAALETLAREELSIDPSELGGSPYVAAATSFGMFALGAAVPLIPLFFATGTAAIFASALVSAISLFVIGALITVITGRPAIAAGLRQLAIGAAAAMITFAVGRLVGVAIG